MKVLLLRALAGRLRSAGGRHSPTKSNIFLHKSNNIAKQVPFSHKKIILLSSEVLFSCIKIAPPGRNVLFHARKLHFYVPTRRLRWAGGRYSPPESSIFLHKIIQFGREASLLHRKIALLADRYQKTWRKWTFSKIKQNLPYKSNAFELFFFVQTSWLRRLATFCHRISKVTFHARKR